MYTPQSLIARGSFLSTGNPVTFQVQPGLDYMLVKNRTQWGNAAATVIQSEWFTGLAAGSAYQITNTVTTNVMKDTFATTNGFTYIDPDFPITYAPVALATPFFTAANPIVFTTATAHGLNVGDTVIFTNMTGARQIAGPQYTVSAVPSTTTFSVLINSTGFVVGTAGFVQKVSNPLFIPQANVITGMTSASSAVVTLAQGITFTVGQYVRIVMPAGWGMSEAVNGVLALVTAVNNSPTVNTVTLNYNSTGQGTFAFPLTAAVPISFPELVPVGTIAETVIQLPNNASFTIENMADAVRNNQFRGIILGTGVVGSATGGPGSTPDVIDWWMFKADVTLVPGIFY
jgi:hypothetical protein